MAESESPKLTPSGRSTLYVIAVVAIVIPILLIYVLVFPLNLPTTHSASTTTTSAAPSTITIPLGISNDKALNFSPDSISVPPGTTITFVNQDTKSIHDIDFTSQPGNASIATSPNTNKWTNNMYTVTLTVPGSYTFVCDYHSWMIGYITVT